MDPVGPWSAYPYNRLAAVQPPATTGEPHHLGAPAAAASTTTAQILPAGFLSPPPVGYEVFSPLFHPAGAAKAHYVNQHRQAAAVATSGTATGATAKPPSEGEYHQNHHQSSFFDQTAWQQGGPFGILPHESGTQKNTPSGGYEVGFNFATQQQGSRANPRVRSPTRTQPTNREKSNPSANPNPNPNPSVGAPQIQTKAQTKIYPELSSTSERSRNEPPQETQSAPSSNYTFPNNGVSTKRNFANYRHHFASENDFQPRPKAEYSANGVESTRKPSPLQSQASPMGHSHSPSYPLYNSPMSSISSPQQSNQVTPPLDASVARTNHQQTGGPPGGNAVYSSVITKANDRFPGNCWDDRRKFPPQANYANVDVASIQNRNAAILNMDRQQYFDASSSQVSAQVTTMTDLSSCRGDPMSIVKNLQQNCLPTTTIEIKQEDKARRRKSGEKPETPMENYYPNPIPPPAHSSGSGAQQPNGTYFEFERWNQPKLFASQPIHHQQHHQSLMVPPPPPPIPYFPTFHLPHAHASTEYPSSVELTPLASYSEQAQQGATESGSAAGGSNANQFQPVPEEQSKVIVPNIEEELNFLSEVDRNAGRVNCGTGGGSRGEVKIGGGGGTYQSAGFMNSYLKFLQGDKDDSSPPPSVRNRKSQSAWNRKTPPNPDLPKPPHQLESNGTPQHPNIPQLQNNITTPNTPTTPISTPLLPNPHHPTPSIVRLSQGDPQDDPRYFPLPKERKKNATFDSSDDGFSSEEDYFGRKPIAKSEPVQEKPRRKGRPPKTAVSEKKKQPREVIKVEKVKVKENRGSQVTPRRETSKRAAKEKSSIKQLIAREEEYDEPADFADSDSDPAWTPLAKEDGDDEVPKKNKRGRRKGFKSLLSGNLDGSNLDDECGLKKQKRRDCPRSEHLLGGKMASEEDGFFKVGEFVVIQGDLSQEWPAIWRVDGKALLQKYEPFEQNGQTLYRNISTYTSWTPESKKQYVSVPIRYKSQGQMETVVEFLRNEMTFVDENFVRTALKENEVYQDNFEVYIQTLISQALDSNFLTEIFQEKDEYFLSNVQTVDDITNGKCDKLSGLLGWPGAVRASVRTWPCYNVIRELGVSDSQNKQCAGCAHLGVTVRVLLYGQPYNSTTLEGCQPNPQAVNEKDFLMCKICASRVQLLNKITHQKYLMYIECAKKVADKRSSDPQKDTTCILNELLADETWLNQLFLDVRNSWCEVDSLEHNHKARVGVTGGNQ